MSEYHFCPICGKNLNRGHRCDPRTLAAIDGANTRAERYEGDAFLNITEPKFHDKLRDAERMLKGEY